MTRVKRIAVAALHGLVMGTLLFLALLQLYQTSSGAAIFRYQGF
jgi:hypothetical protein